MMQAFFRLPGPAMPTVTHRFLTALLGAGLLFAIGPGAARAEPSRLMQAVLEADLQRVEAALAAGGDPNAVDAEIGHSAVHVAVTAGGPRDRAIVEHLLRRSVRLAQADPKTAMPPLAAALVVAEQGPFASLERTRAANIAELLLQHGADPNQRLSGAETPLMLAVSQNNLPAVRALLANGAKPNLQDTNGSTALHVAYATQRGNDMLAALVDAGADPALRDAAGRLPREVRAEAAVTAPAPAAAPQPAPAPPEPPKSSMNKWLIGGAVAAAAVVGAVVIAHHMKEQKKKRQNLAGAGSPSAPALSAVLPVATPPSAAPPVPVSPPAPVAPAPVTPVPVTPAPVTPPPVVSPPVIPAPVVPPPPVSSPSPVAPVKPVDPPVAAPIAPAPSPTPPSPSPVPPARPIDPPVVPAPALIDFTGTYEPLRADVFVDGKAQTNRAMVKGNTVTLQRAVASRDGKVLAIYRWSGEFTRTANGSGSFSGQGTVEDASGTRALTISRGVLLNQIRADVINNRRHEETLLCWSGNDPKAGVVVDGCAQRTSTTVSTLPPLPAVTGTPAGTAPPAPTPAPVAPPPIAPPPVVTPPPAKPVEPPAAPPATPAPSPAPVTPPVSPAPVVTPAPSPAPVTPPVARPADPPAVSPSPPVATPPQALPVKPVDPPVTTPVTPTPPPAAAPVAPPPSPTPPTSPAPPQEISRVLKVALTDVAPPATMPTAQQPATLRITVHNTSQYNLNEGKLTATIDPVPPLSESVAIGQTRFSVEAGGKKTVDLPILFKEGGKHLVTVTSEPGVVRRKMPAIAYPPGTKPPSDILDAGKPETDSRKLTLEVKAVATTAPPPIQAPAKPQKLLVTEFALAGESLTATKPANLRIGIHNTSDLDVANGKLSAVIAPNSASAQPSIIGELPISIKAGQKSFVDLPIQIKEQGNYAIKLVIDLGGIDAGRLETDSRQIDIAVKPLAVETVPAVIPAPVNEAAQQTSVAPSGLMLAPKAMKSIWIKDYRVRENFPELTARIQASDIRLLSVTAEISWHCKAGKLMKTLRRENAKDAANNAEIRIDLKSIHGAGCPEALFPPTHIELQIEYLEVATGHRKIYALVMPDSLPLPADSRPLDHTNSLDPIDFPVMSSTLSCPEKNSKATFKFPLGPCNRLLIEEGRTRVCHSNDLLRTGQMQIELANCLIPNSTGIFRERYLRYLDDAEKRYELGKKTQKDDPQNREPPAPPSKIFELPPMRTEVYSGGSSGSPSGGSSGGSTGPSPGSPSSDPPALDKNKLLAQCDLVNYRGPNDDPQFDSFCKNAYINTCLDRATGTQTYAEQTKKICSLLNNFLKAAGGGSASGYCSYCR